MNGFVGSDYRPKGVNAPAALLAVVAFALGALAFAEGGTSGDYAWFWAGGILWTAYDVAEANVPDPKTEVAAKDTDATGAAVDNADLAVLANAMRDASQ